VELAGQQQAAARGRLRLLLLTLGRAAPRQDPNTESLARIIEQCSAGCAANGGIPSLMYRSQTTDLFSDGRNKNITTTWRATMALRDRRQQLQGRLHRQQAR
jgi:hypothetical protein